MRRTKEQAANTRAAIVDSALRCFDRHGIASSTMEQIACEAGVTKGAVYHHFEGKHEILGAIRDQLSLPLLDEADTALLRASEMPALERVERFLIDCVQNLETDSRKRCALSVMLFKCEYVGELHEQLTAWRRNNDRLMKAFESAYRQARNSGELGSGIVPRAAAVETMMFFSGLVRLWLLDDRADGLRRNAKAAIRTHVRCRAAR
jgi:TetR/AcrR family transcriptional regulator, acrAB operon repressor